MKNVIDSAIKRDYLEGPPSIIFARVCEIVAVAESLLHDTQLTHCITYDSGPTDCAVLEPSKKPMFLMNLEIAACIGRRVIIATDGELSYYIDVDRAFRSGVEPEQIKLTTGDRDHICSSITIWVANPETSWAYHTSRGSGSPWGCSSVSVSKTLRTNRAINCTGGLSAFNPQAGTFSGPPTP